MPTYKKKRRHNKKTHRKHSKKHSRNKKHGGEIINIGRATNKDNKYLYTQISRSIENTGNNFEPYIEPGFNLDVKLHEAKYANDILSSKLDKSHIKVTNVKVRVTSLQEEEQVKLYRYLKQNINDTYFEHKPGKSDEETLFDHIFAWNNRPKDDANKAKYINENKTNFPKYFEKNPASIPQKIDELKDDIYPLITDKIVEHFMDQVPEKDRPSIYVKGDTGTYNNIRYVIMKLLDDINIFIIVNWKIQEEQKKLYEYLNEEIRQHSFDIKYYFNTDDERYKLFEYIIDWGNQVNNEEEKSTSIPQKIDELKDEIYPLITDKIVEHFMSQVPKENIPSMYVKGHTGTYNIFRFVIMKILEVIIFLTKNLIR